MVVITHVLLMMWTIIPAATRGRYGRRNMDPVLIRSTCGKKLVCTKKDIRMVFQFKTNGDHKSKRDPAAYDSPTVVYLDVVMRSIHLLLWEHNGEEWRARLCTL